MKLKPARNKEAGRFFHMINSVSQDAQYQVTIKEHSKAFINNVHIGDLIDPIPLQRADAFCKIHGQWPQYFLEVMHRD